MKTFSISAIDTLLEQHRRQEQSLLGLLQDIQSAFGYLPREALRHAAAALQVPLSRLFSLGTFYNSFSLVQQGDTRISVCHGTACHVKNSGSLMKMISRELGLQQGEETTADAAFSVKMVRCLGCCSIAPAVKVNDTIYGQITQAKIKSILKKHQKK